MSKFHISKDGTARQCRAQSPASCTATPADQKEHYDTREEAQAAYEKKQESTVKPLRKKKKDKPVLAPTTDEQYNNPDLTSFEIAGKSFDKKVWSYNDSSGSIFGPKDTLTLDAGNYQYNIRRYGSGWDVESYKTTDDMMTLVAFPTENDGFKNIDEVSNAVLTVARKRYEKVTSKEHPTDEDFTKYLEKGKRKQERLEA